MKRVLTIAALFFAFTGIQASENVVSLKFNRIGTDAASVAVSVTDAEGTAIDGATATLTSSHTLKATGNAVTESIVCPNVNANTNPTIELTLQVNGLPAGFTFNNIGLDIHALNGGSNYQQNNDGVARQWNIAAATGSSEESLADFGTLTDTDIAAGVGISQVSVHKMWEIASSETVKSEGATIIKLTVTKGVTNGGCFFGLSEVRLNTASTEPTPKPEPEPDDTEAKVYYIQWKNTGGNQITEGSDHYLTVAGKNVSKAQFWKLIPTANVNCYYIKNVVTGRYMGSCNLNPSSASRITTSETPVEYYVKATSATSGEIVGCHYFSSTDCADYSDESKGPRALNKDGASSYVITWQAGTSRVGSYWKLVETTDVYEAPQHTPLAQNLNIYFNPCGTAGSNYLTSAKVHGEGAPGNIIYEASNTPSKWHVTYPHDRGEVARGAVFDIDITIASTPTADLTANAYFDWNADGEFEAITPIALNGTTGTAGVTVPDTAVAGSVRMRLRINSNGLELADDDVEGFVYDFHLTVVDPQEERTATVAVNADNRGTATLSSTADNYTYGTTLTARATPKGDATFVCWREEGVVVSTDAEYTFTVDHNVKLKAYFTANTQVDTDVPSLTIDNADEVTISVQGDNIVATSNTEICSLSLYTIEAALVAQCNGNTLPIAPITQGTYIARATTANGYKNVKLYLNK